MLSIKNICAFSLVFLTHLGCASSYRYQMSDTDTLAQASTSQGVGVQKYVDVSNVDLKAIVQEFLDTEDFKEGYSDKGESFIIIGDEDIDLLLNKLKKNIDRSKLDEDYLKFLKIYGSMYGQGYTICGPTEHTEDKIGYMELMQRSFEDHCVKNSKGTKMKSCWLIARVDQGDKYYIDLSRDMKGYIYSMSSEGKSKIFAKGFLDFLKKLFESYKDKKEENVYEKSICEENVYQKINKLLKLRKSKQGCPIDNDEIRFVLEELGRNENMFDLDSLEEYKEFLNQYGAIHGEGFEICGPTEDMNDTEKKVEYMVSMQSKFEKHLKEQLPRLNEKTKTCWLIAKNGDKQYYIDLSIGRIYIYDIADYGRFYVKIFAKNFLEFLDKFFEDYKKNIRSAVAGSSK